MKENLWTMFCGESGGGSENLGFFGFLVHPSSCIIQLLIIFLDIVLLVVLLFSMFLKSTKTAHAAARFRGCSRLQIVSAVFNGGLGFVNLCLGGWILEENLRNTCAALPLNRWLSSLLQGFTWLVLSLTLSLRLKQLPRQPSRVLSILAFLFSGVVFALSLFAVIIGNEISVKIVLDILTFPGAALLVLCVFKEYKYEDGNEIIADNGLYAPLNGESNGINKGDVDDGDDTTPFSKAGLFSKMSFWWLNPLMKRGREKTLEDEDIPKLRKEDRAESTRKTVPVSSVRYTVDSKKLGIPTEATPTFGGSSPLTISKCAKFRLKLR